MTSVLNNKILEHELKLPLLSTQQGIFLADHLSEVAGLYNIAHCLELPAQLNLDVFRQAIQQGLHEADSVLAEYSTLPEEAYLWLNPDKVINIEYFDFRHLNQADAVQRVWEWMDSDRLQPKSLQQQSQPLLRQVLFQTSEQIFWYQRYHHIMLDGFSLTKLSKRVLEIYKALLAHQAVSATPFTGMLSAVQERQHYVESEQFQKDREFWHSYSHALATPVSLSQQHQAAHTTAEFYKHQIVLSLGITQQIQKLAQQQQLTLPDLMMALSVLYLHRMTQKTQLVVGVPFMRRLGFKALRASLPTVNVLPVQYQVQAQDSWLSLAQHIQQTNKLIRPHQAYDAEQILRDLKAVDAEQRLYGPVLNYKAFDEDFQIHGETVTTHHVSTGPIDDFEFSFLLQQQKLMIELRADRARYTETELAAHAQRLSLLLEQCLAEPNTACYLFKICSQQEEKALLAYGTGPQFSHPTKYNNVLDIFYEQASRYPERTALVSGESTALTQVTFAELAQKINQMTRYLWSMGAKKNTVIAAAIPRSTESIVVMLSVLNSGASFLPLDLDYPIDRMGMMCEDAHPLFILTHQHLQQQLPEGVRQVYLDDRATQQQIAQQPSEQIWAEQREFAFQDVAYVIFTSGSTGRPKGVMNTHGSLLNLILSHRETVYQPVLEAVAQRFPERTLRAAHTHSFSFDSSWLQIFWMLWGQELHIFDENMRRDAYGLVQEIQQRQIDTLDLPPSFCAQMISNGLFAPHQHHPRLILIGGEAAPLSLWQQLNAQPELFAHNLYGPTEYTVDTFRAELKQTERPVIGRPIGNTFAYVLDQKLNPCATGVIGELYISGFGIANGYLGRADLSSTRFIANPYLHGQRMYRTGDLVRWNEQGKLEFMGRCDDQIKIRGYRVEIGEVENALSVLPDVESIAVIAEPIHNSHRLLGYCVVRDVTLTPDIAEQRAQFYLELLHQRLPEYMVPSALMVLAEFPRNVSGKIDKKALPRPQASSKAQAPQTDLEKRLCQAMAKVLKLDTVGVNDDFFAVGGDSISAIMLCTELRQQGYLLKPSAVFQQKRVAQLQHSVQQQTQQAPAVVASVPPELLVKVRQQWGENTQAVALLPLQKGMLFHTQTESHNARYSAFTHIRLQGQLDQLRLQKALNAVLLKHPQLSGYFDEQLADEAIFVYDTVPTSDFPLQWFVTDHADLAAQIEQVIQQPLTVDQPYGLIRAVVLQHEQHYELLILVHHLMTDGWSTPLFLDDLFAAYQQPEQPLATLAQPYDRVIAELIARPVTESQSIWQQDLQGCNGLNLFEKNQQKPVQEHLYTLSPELSSRLQQQLKQQGITLNVFMQMLWAMWLAQYSHREDLVFGTPVAGRSAAITGLEQQIGLFLNTVPVRVQLDMQQNLWAQLASLQQQHVRHLEHDALGLSEIQALTGQNSLFDSLLVVENYPDHRYENYQLDQLQVNDISNRGYSHYPLALLVIPDTQIELILEQRGVLSQPVHVLQRLEQWIEIALQQPDLPVCQYPLQVAAERALLQQIQQTAQPLSVNTLQQLLRKSYREYATQPALADQQHQLSFSQVEQQIYALAQRLQQQGVQAGDIVAVALPRSVQLSLAILAVIELGACYLPLDIQLPDERLAFMLENAQARAVITTSALAAHFPSTLIQIEFNDLLATPIDVSTYQPNTISQHAAAYLIYTSGTTGRPKGVQVSHQAIVNRIQWMQSQYPLTAQDVILQKTPCGFDVSVWEFFWSYLVGAQLVMAPVNAHQDPQVLCQCIERDRVTTVHFVPSMLAVFVQYLAQQPCELTLQRVFCSGEALPTALVKQFVQYSSAELHNLYGPTEAAVDVSYYDARQALQSTTSNSIPIGFPVWNTQLHILDQYLRPVALGVEGELYLSGTQLALGYLGQTALTAQRFVAHPFAEGERMYRTGDHAYWLDNGAVQYVGRVDDQLKIRGQRIELAEIEQQIRQCIDIENVVVHAIDFAEESTSSQHALGDQRQLVAYLQREDALNQIEEQQLRQTLQKRLPMYMQPVAYVVLAQLPVSHNGKLDRKALPQPERMQQQNTQRLALSLTEVALVSIFQKLLGTQRDLHVQDDFFSLGGHSLLAMQLAIEIRKQFQVQIPVSQIMAGASIEKLAEYISLKDRLHQVQQTGLDEILQIRQAQTTPVFCIYPGSGAAWQYSILNRHIHSEISLIGLQSPRPAGALSQSQSMQALVQYHVEQILTLQPEGQYCLLGYSLGGMIAYGVAERLQALGKTVAYVGLLDTYPAEIHPWDDENAEAITQEAEQEQLHFFEQVLSDADETMLAETERLQADIFANYRDAVRLLRAHKTPHYHGKIHVVVAEKSLPNYIQPERDWSGLVGELQLTRLPYATHEDLLAPETFVELGQILNHELCQALAVVSGS